MMFSYNASLENFPIMYNFYVRNVLYDLKTLYLFTADDFISIILTNTTCGVALPLAGGLLQQPVSIFDVAPRLPLVLLWVWANLLLFNMSNQSQPEAILEDVKNKPWRPIACGRISAQRVKLYPSYKTLALGSQSCVGGHIS